MICTFCFKAVNYCSENESKDRLLFKRFIDLVQRYFGKNFELKAGVLDELESCQDCDFLIKTFCDFYNELRGLELQLELKVQKMLEVVTAAEKVPSSTRLAKEKLERREQVGDGSLYEVVCEFRKDFKRKCTRHISSSLPRVLVERIEMENNDKSLTKWDNIILQTNTNENSEMAENGYLLLGWISTLVGVVWLGWSCWPRTPTTTLTTTTFSDDNNGLKIHSIYRENDDISSTITRCNRTPHEESFRSDSSSKSQSTIFEHEENPETVSACHTITSSDATSSLWKDNLIPNAHVKLNPPLAPAENVALAVVSKASTRFGKIMTQFVCDLCQKGFKSKTSLVRHKQTVHVSRDQWPYYCSLCNRRYSTLCNFKRHKRTIEHNDKLKILEDSKVYSTATTCNFPAPQEEYFGSDSSSNSQSNVLQLENSKTVSVCRRITSSDACPPSWNHVLTPDTYVELKKESIILVHPQPDPAENVAIAVDLKASAKSGKLMTQYVCDLCQKKLKSQISLVRHKKTVHVSRDKWPYYCCICNRRYSTHCHLKRHNKTIEHNFRKSLAKVHRGKRHQ
ncbi:unnamed protein product [Orchesella dallaii]|uniref:C2H2-type domain-containing protein n=1 Tax=Orchesella dallaii TaxID=48710 RepID=A0ABP1QUK9_9HEXA